MGINFIMCNAEPGVVEELADIEGLRSMLTPTGPTELGNAVENYLGTMKKRQKYELLREGYQDVYIKEMKELTDEEKDERSSYGLPPLGGPDERSVSHSRLG